MECTFVDDDVSPDKAAGKGHQHVQDIADLAEHFRNDNILLIHLSAR